MKEGQLKFPNVMPMIGGLPSLYPRSVEGDCDDRMEHCVSSDNLPFVSSAIWDGYFACLTAIRLSWDSFLE